MDGFVNWDYRWRAKLEGWVNTERLIRATLQHWYPGETIPGELIENGTPEEFRKFLSGLPSENGSGFEIVYLASHQSEDGRWKFASGGEERTWENLLEGAMPAPSSRRIVLLDACFAQGVPDRWRKLPALSLFACTAEERTFGVYLNRKQPVHFKKYYPREVAWLEARFGEEWMRKDSRLSFLGFAWLRAFLEWGEEKAPGSMEEWEGFLRRCEQEALRFAEERSRRVGSTLRVERGSR